MLDNRWKATDGSRGCFCIINARRSGVKSHTVPSTVKALLFSSICTTLFPITSCPSRLMYIPKVLSTLLPGCGADRLIAPSISVKVFFIGSSSFLVSSAACLVALTIGWKRVCNSFPIASFNSRFSV